MSEEHSTEENKKSFRSINRRKFVKAIGGTGSVAIAGGVFSSPAQAAPSLNSISSKKGTPITGDKLKRLMYKTIKQSDVKNVMNSQMAKAIKSGEITELPHSRQTGQVLVSSTSRDVKEDDLNNLAEDDIVVSGVQHLLDDGNRLTAVAYATGGGRAVTYYDYDEAKNNIRNQAKLMKFDTDPHIDNPKLVLEKSSINGTLSKSVSSLSRCEGCEPGPRATGSAPHQDCVESDIFCLGSCCAACGITKGCLPCMVGCITLWCMGCLHHCCERHKTGCHEC